MDRNLRILKEVNNIWKMTYWVYLANTASRVYHIGTKNMQKLRSKSMQRVVLLKLMTCLLADWSNVVLHIHDYFCWCEMCFFVSFWDDFCRSTNLCQCFKILLWRRNGVDVLGRTVVEHPFLSMVSIRFLLILPSRVIF